MRAWLAAVAIAATASAAMGAPAYQPRQSPWASRPTQQDIAQALPADVRAAGGRVILRCRAAAQGDVSDCTVAAETPVGRGLGRAMLALAPKYRLRPDAVKEAAPDGYVTIREGWYRTDGKIDWRRQPGIEDLVAAWPMKAYIRGGGGSATIDCLAAIQGSLYDCVVLHETPAGDGFGAAALALTPQFQMKPATRDGQPAVAEVVIPINFKADGIKFQPDRQAVPDTPFYYVVPPAVAWLEAPTAEDVAAAYPPKAKAAKLDGFAGVNCGFDAQGRLNTCHLTREEPTGHGFGSAAVALTRRFHIAPTTLGDRPINRAQVSLLVTFDAAALESGKAFGKPVWVRAPDTDALRAAIAKQKPAGPSGRATLSCRVQQGGGMGDCRVVSEEPAGSGLGQTALALQDAFGVATWSEEGLPVVGRAVRFPVRIDLDEAPPPATGPVAAATPAKP